MDTKHTPGPWVLKTHHRQGYDRLVPVWYVSAQNDGQQQNQDQKQGQDQKQNEGQQQKQDQKQGEGQKQNADQKNSSGG